MLVGLERGPCSAQAVEPANQRLDVARRVPIADADLVFLAAGVLLALAEPLRFAQLESGVHAPAGRERGRQHRAHLEGRAAVIEVVRVDVRRVGEQVAAEVLAHLSLGQLGEVVAQLRGCLAPGEVGIGLRESHLRQRTHARRARERLREKDHVGVIALRLGDQPAPERHGFGVRVVHPEDPDAALDPGHHHAEPCAPERLACRRIGPVEIDGVDVLVFLGRVLRVLDRAIRGVPEPLRVLADPGVVWRCLHGEVERQLHAVRLDRATEVLELGQAAELSRDLSVAAI